MHVLAAQSDVLFLIGMVSQSRSNPLALNSNDDDGLSFKCGCGTPLAAMFDCLRRFALLYKSRKSVWYEPNVCVWGGSKTCKIAGVQTIKRTAGTLVCLRVLT